jgi:hypothetical protein
LCSTLRADGLKFETLYDLGPNLCWTCMFAFYSIEIWENGGPCCWRAWLAGVKRYYMVDKLGEGFPPLLARRWMNGDWRRC